MLNSVLTRGPRLRPLAVCFMATCVPFTIWAQEATGSAVEQLRQRFMGGAATAIIHVSNLHGTTRAVVRPVDNLVVGGAVQSRPFAGLLRGADEIIPAGQTVRVLGVETVAGKRNDLLRITVVTSGNAVAPVAFVLPSDGARTMTEAQLEALVVPILTPANAGPGAPGAQAGRGAPGTGAARGTAPAPPVGWVVRRTPAGVEAVLRGTAQTMGHTNPALLVLGCPTIAIAQDRPAMVPFAELRVPKSSVTFDLNFVGEKDGDDNGYVHVQASKGPEIRADLATWTTVPDTGNVAPLGLDLRGAEMEQIMHAPPGPLQVTITPTDPPQAGISAHFTAPDDASSAQAAMASCMEAARTAEAADRAQKLVACPVVPDLVLTNTDVRRAATGKPLPVDPDRDQGVGWTLPKATKAHPVVAKTVLVCSYGAAGQKSETSKPIKVETLPIPPEARFCESWMRVAENRSEAYCKRTDH